MAAKLATEKTETFRRTIEIDRRSVDETARTVDLSFSSEKEVERWFGVEVLGHETGNVRLDRLLGGAPLLLNHDSAKQVGVVESARIEGGKGRATVRFSKSALGEEVFQDVRDGIRRLVSVGYRIHETVTEKKAGGVEAVRVTDWEPLEISIVAVPADETVGVGRAAQTQSNTMNKPTAAVEPETQTKPDTTRALAPEPNETKIEVREVRDPKAEEKGAAAERARIAEITAVASMYPGNQALRAAAEKAVADGVALGEFRAEALKCLATKPIVPTATEARDLDKFSIVRGITRLLQNQPLDGIEGEMHAEGLKEASRCGISPQGNFVVPTVALNHGRRDLTVTGGSNGSQGGVTVATSVGSVIELLYAKSVLRGLGVQFLTGLVGNITFPKLTAGSAGYHVGENAAPTESSPTMTSASLSPNRLATFVEISKQLLLQSNASVEALVRADLATALSLGMEAGALTGTGANNQPLGLLTYAGGAFTSGITEVVGGTDGAAPSWANIVKLETEVATLNADIGSLAYLTNPKVRGKMKSTSKVASSDSVMLWGDNASPVNGYRAEVTTTVPSDLDKGSATGVCSAMLFGNWSDLIVGMWGGIDLMVNPYSLDKEGLVRITATAFYDTVVRRGASFAALRDVLTS